MYHVQMILFVLAILPIEYCHGVVFPIGKYTQSIFHLHKLRQISIFNEYWTKFNEVNNMNLKPLLEKPFYF